MRDDEILSDAITCGVWVVTALTALGAVIITLAAIAYGHAITRAEAVALGCSDYHGGEYAACLEARK